VSYDRLAHVFVEAIKELNRENKLLKKENIELNEKYNKLLENIIKIINSYSNYYMRPNYFLINHLLKLHLHQFLQEVRQKMDYKMKFR